jgi:hypothetical protein
MIITQLGNAEEGTHCKVIVHRYIGTEVDSPPHGRHSSISSKLEKVYVLEIRNKDSKEDPLI